jgi:hypothetical protein
MSGRFSIRRIGRIPNNWSAPIFGKIGVTSEFGVPRGYRGSGKTHKGIDISAKEGTKVYAIGDGKVIKVVRNWQPGSRPFGGNMVIIQHANGLRSGYMHLSKVAVDVGEPITGGTYIGDSGCTGGNRAKKAWAKPMAPHLHFMIWIGRDPVPVPPRPYLKEQPTAVFVCDGRKKGFDLNGNGKLDVELKFVWHNGQAGFDLDNDGKPDLLAFSFVRHGGYKGFDLDGDGKPDIRLSFVRHHSLWGFDLDGDGKPDIGPVFVRSGNRWGFDLDGDGKPDIAPVLVRSRGRVGFDVDGDGHPDIYPTFVRIGPLGGFDLDGDGRPDIFPALMRSHGKVGFDLDGDGRPDLFPTFIRHGLRIGLDLDGDGKSDIFPSFSRGATGQWGFDLDGDGQPDLFPPSGFPGGIDLDNDGVPDYPSGTRFVFPSSTRFNNPLDEIHQPFNKPLEHNYGPGGMDNNPNTPW